MSFVVDTNICSAYVRGHPLVFNRFLQYSGQLFISVVTFGEPPPPPRWFHGAAPAWRFSLYRGSAHS